MGYLIDWIGFRLSKTDDPFLMLDPFISYKEEIVEHLQQFETSYSPKKDIESRGESFGESRKKESYE